MRHRLLQLSSMLNNGLTTENDLALHVGKVLDKTSVFLVDLVRELARVAHYQHTNLALDRLELLECGEHKHSGLAHTRLGLAQHIHPQDGLRNALALHFRRVLETAVLDRTLQL